MPKTEGRETEAAIAALVTVAVGAVAVLRWLEDEQEREQRSNDRDADTIPQERFQKEMRKLEAEVESW